MENENKKNEIMLKGVTSLNTNLFGESNVKQITSLDPNNEEHVDMLLNAMQDVDYKLNDVVDKEIKVMGFMATERPIESANEETGEVVVRYKKVLMLFDTDGKSYVTGSSACFMSFNAIVAGKGVPTENNILTLIPTKVAAKQAGHSYLKLKIAK